jgi:hypothetical protein
MVATVDFVSDFKLVATILSVEVLGYKFPLFMDDATLRQCDLAFAVIVIVLWPAGAHHTSATIHYATITIHNGKD